MYHSANVRKPLLHWVYTYLRNAIPLWHRCFLCGGFVALHLVLNAGTPSSFNYVHTKFITMKLKFDLYTEMISVLHTTSSLPNLDPNYGSQHSSSRTYLYPCALPKSFASIGPYGLFWHWSRAMIHNNDELNKIMNPTDFTVTYHWIIK